MHLENEEQQCRGADVRVQRSDRWRAISELQTQRMNTRYQDDMREKNSVIADLKERDRVRDQHLVEVQVQAEFQRPRERLRHEESAVGQLRGSVVNFEAVRSELVERLDTNARLDALREQSMHQVRDKLQHVVSGFRASEMESESEQLRTFLVRAQELAGVEQVAEQAAMVSHAEHRANEEHSAICRNERIQDYEAQQELDRLRSDVAKAV